MAERNLDFDKVINRKNTRCLKYDFAVKRGKPADVLPLWVADMDFETSSYIEDALVERAKEGIFGYSEVQTPYFEILANWMKLHHNWEIQEDWLIKTPGVVFALAMAVKAYTQPGDSVLIQLPVYYPFSEVIQDNGRKVVSSNLYQGEDNRYHIDFQDFEKKIVEENVKLFFLCNPHNPVGRVWSAEELEKLGDICVKNGVTVVSDEIHQDFVFKGKHQVFAGLKKEFQDISITCTSPSKTFNLASMMLLFIIIHTNQKNFTAIILQAVQIIFSLDLFHCLFCGMPPLQFNNQSRQITISIWLKYNICKPFSSWHFPMQGIVLLSRVVCQGNHTRQCVFIVVFQDRYICLMYLFDQLCNSFFVT